MGQEMMSRPAAPDAQAPNPNVGFAEAASSAFEAVVTRVVPIHRIPGLPLGSAERKEFPVGTGVIVYFTAAVAEIAHVSWVGNQKHNPGERLHHARGKSMDHDDCILRHYTERGTWDLVEFELNGKTERRWVLHSALLAWRALAALQQECEDLGAPLARGAIV